MANFTTTSGTKTLVVNTEYSAANGADFNSGTPRTATGYVSVRLDFSGVVAGDTVQVRVYHAVAGGTLTADDVATISPGTIWRANLGLLEGNWDVTITQTVGTGRAIRYSVVVDTNDVNAATVAAGAVTSIQSGLALSATALSTAQWTNGRAAGLDNLDAAVSTRSPLSSALSTAQWTNGRAGLLDNLANVDAAVSSRAPSSTAVLNTDLTAGRAAKLDNLDVASSTRAPASSALSAAQWTNARAVNLDALDVAVSSRASSGAVTGVQTDTTSLLTRLTFTRAGLIDNLSLLDTATSAIGGAVTAVGALVANVQSRIPAGLSGGNMPAAVQSMASGALDAIFAYVVEAGAPSGSQTFLQGVRAMWSVLLRKASGLAITTPGTEHFRNGADTKDVVAATLGSDGTRTVTVDGT